MQNNSLIYKGYEKSVTSIALKWKFFKSIWTYVVGLYFCTGQEEIIAVVELALYDFYIFVKVLLD